MAMTVDELCKHGHPVRWNCLLCSQEKTLNIVPHRTLPQYDELLARIAKLERENQALRNNNANIAQRLNELLLGLDKISL